MLPGLPFPIIDAHTHLMPERLMRAVRAYMRAHLWHPRYDGTTEELVPLLLGAGVDGFVFSAYAHRGDMAQSLNHWVANVQATYSPQAVGFGTFHPEDGSANAELAEEAFGTLGLAGAKLHPQVGSFALDDPRLIPVYEAALRHGKPLLIHAGTRPEDSIHTGSLAMARVLRRFPDLKVIVAHMGADQFDAFFDLCGEYPGLHLDTAMVFNGYLGGPPRIERVLEYQDRVLYGSDFPNVPYRVESALQAIRDLRLGQALEHKLLCANAARVLDLDPTRFAAF